MIRKVFYLMLAVVFMAAISSCEGDEGPAGQNGQNGQPGQNGPAGQPGENPRIDETTGTWWIGTVDTGISPQGENGENGLTPFINETTGTWWIGAVDTGIQAQGPGVPTVTVTFDADNGSPLNTQKGVNGFWAREPKDPEKSGNIPLNDVATGGLYRLDGANAIVNRFEFAGWYKEGDTEPFDFDSPITDNIILKAKWKAYGINLPAAANDTEYFNNVISYIGGNVAAYALLLDKSLNIAGSTTRVLNANRTKLTLIGLDSERKISLTSRGRILGVTSTNSDELSIDLTLGNNITLVGLTSGQNGATQNNDHSVLRVQNGNLIMLEGSKITGNTSVSQAASTEEGAAVYINSTGSLNANFIMKGGTITGNSSTVSANTQLCGGLAIRGGGSSASLEGGSIIGNTGVWTNDINVERSSLLTLSGTANVGVLTLTATTAPPISATIASNWIGTLGSLNLNGLSLNTPADIPGVIARWEGNTVLAGVNAANVGNFSLGNFLMWDGTNIAFTPQLISNTHFIDETGVLRVKP